MSDVAAVTGAGEAGSTGGETTELTTAETGATGADQSGQGEGTGAVTGTGEAGEGGSEGEGAATRVEPSGEDVNKRFSKVTRERDEAQRQAREANENLTRALAALDKAGGVKKPDATPTPAADDIGAEPEPPEFLDPEQYQRDMADYTRKVVDRTTKLQLKEAETRRATDEANRRNQEEALEHGRAWMARRQKAMDEMPDYADVAENNDLHISQTMVIAITSSDHGPKVAYYLGQHPELAERISKMKPALQLMEMGRLEAQITAPKTPKVSKAPEPIKVTTGSGEPQAKSLDDLSMDEYAAQRSKRH